MRGVEGLTSTFLTKIVVNMFNIGDCVLNEKTGNIGKVIGYGHQLLTEGYTTTLKVLVEYGLTPVRRGSVEEDIYSSWVEWAES